MSTSLPTNRIKKIKLPDNTEYTVAPEILQNSGYQASLPTLSADDTLMTLDTTQVATGCKSFNIFEFKEWNSDGWFSPKIYSTISWKVAPDAEGQTPTYGVRFPSTSGYSADRTLATTADINTEIINIDITSGTTHDTAQWFTITKAQHDAALNKDKEVFINVYGTSPYPTYTFKRTFINVSNPADSTDFAVFTTSSPYKTVQGSALGLFEGKVASQTVNNTTTYYFIMEALTYLQEALPSITSSDYDKYLHTNASTGALEWAVAASGGISDVKVISSSVVSGGIATIPAATDSVAGVISTSAQTFAGDKTFTGQIITATPSSIWNTDKGIKFGGGAYITGNSYNELGIKAGAAIYQRIGDTTKTQLTTTAFSPGSTQDNNLDLGYYTNSSTKSRWRRIYLSEGIRKDNSSYSLLVPTMTSWTSDKTIATTDDIPSVSLTTTTGSEAITVDSNSLNVVTRDTAQTIAGVKKFTGGIQMANNIVPETNNSQNIGTNSYHFKNGYINHIYSWHGSFNTVSITDTGDTPLSLMYDTDTGSGYFMSTYDNYADSYSGFFRTQTLTAERYYTFPDRSGIIGMQIEIDDITTI